MRWLCFFEWVPAWTPGVTRSCPPSGIPASTGQRGHVGKFGVKPVSCAKASPTPRLARPAGAVYERDVSGSDGLSSTQRHVEPSDSWAGARVPVLLWSVRHAQAAGGAVPRVVPISRTMTVGRGRADVDQTPERLLLSDALLSRTHLRITRKRGGCEIEDLGSLNGTFVDGRRLTAPVRLCEGSIVFFGDQVAVFRVVTESALEAIAEEAIRPFGPVATVSPSLAETTRILRRIASTEGELLMLGETGVGKEVYARAIHEVSGRRGSFVAVNCAALPAELVESELFGYERGAHSTATGAKPGLIRMADQGTLFLDEIGDMDPRVGTKLLRFLQDREVIPLGATRGVRVNARIIAATSRMSEPGPGSSKGSAGVPLRADLLGRLGAEPIAIPPLRERIEDLGMLATHFAGPGKALDTDAFRALCLYCWPRNVRELEKIVARAAAIAHGDTIRVNALPAAVRQRLDQGPTFTARRRPRPAPTRAELEMLLREHCGNVTAMARALDRRWNVVWRWLVKHRLQPETLRGGGVTAPDVAEDAGSATQQSDERRVEGWETPKAQS